MATWTVAALCWFGIGNCLFAPGPTGERELRPPVAGIKLGSLYYVREAPTEDISKPANLIKLCTTRLERYGIVLEPQPGADIDLLEKLDVNAALDGIKVQFAQLGLNGSLGNYYNYTLKNVIRTDISRTQADRIMNQRGEEDDCSNWRESMRGNQWGVYQILAISTGDISFSRNRTFEAGADVKAKLLTLEPKLKAAIKNATGLSFSGKGLVVSFQPVLRN
jgi:hypothetical protein